MTPTQRLRATLDAFDRLSPFSVSTDLLWPAVLAAALDAPADAFAAAIDAELAGDPARARVLLVIDAYRDPRRHVVDGDLVPCYPQARCPSCRLAAPALPASAATTVPGAALAAHHPGRTRVVAAAPLSARPPAPAHWVNRGTHSDGEGGEPVRRSA